MSSFKQLFLLFLSTLIIQNCYSEKVKNNPLESKAKISAQKIKGAFGMKLGDYFDTSKAIGSSSVSDGTPLYEFEVKKTFRSFSKYYVAITPKTKKIAAIWAVGHMKSEGLGEKEQDLIMSLLQDKYGKSDYLNFNNLFGCKAFKKGKRQIITKVSGFGKNITISIRYEDETLEDLAEKERISLESKKVDSSAL